MHYTLEGVTCNACKMMIEMAFEEHGYTGCQVDVDAKVLTVPDDVTCGDDEVMRIVEGVGAYKAIKREL